MPESIRASVFVVDDDADIRESLRFLFEDAGYTVEEAEDGMAALTLLRSDRGRRVLLLDRMMPRMDGIETLQCLSTEPSILKRTAILFMTARHDPPTPEASALIERFATATVSKPFNLEILLATVQAASHRLAECASRE